MRILILLILCLMLGGCGSGDSSAGAASNNAGNPDSETSPTVTPDAAKFDQATFGTAKFSR